MEAESTKIKSKRSHPEILVGNTDKGKVTPFKDHVRRQTGTIHRTRQN